MRGGGLWYRLQMMVLCSFRRPCGRLLFHLLYLSLVSVQTLPADIKESITDIIKFMLQREYVKVLHVYEIPRPPP